MQQHRTRGNGSMVRGASPFLLSDMNTSGVDSAEKRFFFCRVRLRPSYSRKL